MGKFIYFDQRTASHISAAFTQADDSSVSQTQVNFQMTNDVLSSLYFRQITALSMNSFPCYCSRHKIVKPQIMSHFFSHLCAADCYLGNMALSPQLAWALLTEVPESD